MVTYRKDLTRKHWHRPWPVRVLLVVGGLVLILAGAVGSSLEEVYGGDPDRQEYVVGHDAETGVATVSADDGEVREFADIADAEAYMGERRGGRNYTVPILLHASGALSIVMGIAPSPVRRELEPGAAERAAIGA